MKTLPAYLRRLSRRQLQTAAATRAGNCRQPRILTDSAVADSFLTRVVFGFNLASSSLAID